MADEEKTNVRLEIAHVLFMDIVGYSKGLNDEQRESLQELNNLVLRTDAVREAEAAGSLVRLPTGDGMALVFTGSMEAPVECALQISQGLRAQGSLPLRMGIHSGSVQHVVDVNGRHNIAGAGINIAQRVMDCGDAGHILVSRRVADDLAGSRRWAPLLHDLGDVEVKHGLVVRVVNLYADAVGNPAAPARFGGGSKAVHKKTGTDRGRLVGAGACVLVLAGAGWWWTAHRQPAVSTPGPVATASPAPRIPDLPVLEKSVAVLPFANLSADKDNAFFADGVQDEVLTDLAKVADLKVISRTSVMQYRDANRNLPEIARALGVAYVVEGSVQRAGNKIRVTAQLIEARTDAHRWAEKYDRPLDDVFAIQSEIAQAIAGQLQATISPQAQAAMVEIPTRDLKAYELYLRARSLWNVLGTASIQAGLEPIFRLLAQATERDPQFARAYALLAYAHGFAYNNFDPSPARKTAFRQAVEAAVRLAPGSVDAHLAAGSYTYYVEQDFARAREELLQTTRLAPNNADAYNMLAGVERRLGRWDDSLARFRRGEELNPENTNNATDHLLTLGNLRRYPEALALIDRLTTLHGREAALLADLQLVRASVSFDWKADPRAAHAMLADLPAFADATGAVTDLRLFFDWAARDHEAAARDLAACPLPEINGTPRAEYEATNASLRGDKAAAEKINRALRPLLAAKVEAAPGNADTLLSLAKVDVGLGRKADAIAEARRAAALRPLDRDAYRGPFYALGLAEVLALAGEREEAIGLVLTLCALPCGPSYGILHLEPALDGLRGDGRFEAAVAALAPKP